MKGKAWVHNSLKQVETPVETALGIPGNGPVQREALRSGSDWIFKLEFLKLFSKFRQGDREILGSSKRKMVQILYLRHSAIKMKVNGSQEGKKIDVKLG